ncbi:MAG: 30S ribosomal protein S19e [Candidatus Iainarchaeum archaeon]|uniref:30S ribosomal protein S19e n=1 Tax=Candidatus Iainarchaeum sp. TaxID=3101447 RepID=A0A7T9DJZ0_9ARCH|nr:MAG: 30S ribosomal protein S19e [Candidatus Diapherotrites archaeon]
MGVYDVPIELLLEAISNDLKKENTVQAPAFTAYVKSGVHAERAPQNEDWYFVRCASILYRVFKDGPVGTESLRTYYGGRKARGSKPHAHRKASGKIIRLALQQLEKAKLIVTSKTGGRTITPAGQKYLNTMSKLAMEASKTRVKKKRVFQKRSKADADTREALKRGKGKASDGEAQVDKAKDKKKKGDEDSE